MNQYRPKELIQLTPMPSGWVTPQVWVAVQASGGSGGRVTASEFVSSLNIVTASANLTSSQIITGNGSKGVAAGGATIAEIRNAPSNKFTLVNTESGEGGLAAGKAYLHQSPADDQWSSVQYVEVGPVDADGYRPPLRDAVGGLAGGLITVSGFDNLGAAHWATWTIASVVDDEGVRANVGSLVASSGSLGDLTERVTVAVLPLGASDIDTPGSVGQVALFDVDGKLNGTAMLVVDGEDDLIDIGDVSGAIIRIGDNTTPTITLGPSGGGGSVTVHSDATFNGALLSPGTGAYSFKAGVNAVAAGENAVVIGRNASTGTGQGGVAIGASARVDGVNGGGVAIGQSAYVGNHGGLNSAVAIGYGAYSISFRSVAVGAAASCSGDNSVALGNSASASTNAVALGYNVSASANAFVMGNSSNNYQMPGTIATNLRFRTTTGTKIGTAPNQLLGFWNATPVNQPDNLTAAGEDLGEVQALANGIRSLLIEIGLMAPDP